jgi:hypothetical protein
LFFLLAQKENEKIPLLRETISAGQDLVVITGYVGKEKEGKGLL